MKLYITILFVLFTVASCTKSEPVSESMSYYTDFNVSMYAYLYNGDTLYYSSKTDSIYQSVDSVHAADIDICIVSSGRWQPEMFFISPDSLAPLGHPLLTTHTTYITSNTLDSNKFKKLTNFSFTEVPVETKIQVPGFWNTDKEVIFKNSKNKKGLIHIKFLWDTVGGSSGYSSIGFWGELKVQK